MFAVFTCMNDCQFAGMKLIAPKTVVNIVYYQQYTHNIFKACVRYFLSNFYFFHQMIALQKLWKMFFISSKKALFVFKIFKFLWIFPFLSKLSRFKRTNGSGIICDAINWLAWICICNFWNNSKTALHYIIKLGPIIYN